MILSGSAVQVKGLDWLLCSLRKRLYQIRMITSLRSRGATRKQCAVANGIALVDECNATLTHDFIEIVERIAVLVCERLIDKRP